MVVFLVVAPTAAENIILYTRIWSQRWEFKHTQIFIVINTSYLKNVTLNNFLSLLLTILYISAQKSGTPACLEEIYCSLIKIYLIKTWFCMSSLLTLEVSERKLYSGSMHEKKELTKKRI